jgi:excisionase family DNA binding protein
MGYTWGMVKPLILPDGFADIGPITSPEFMPNQSTMDRFEADPWELRRACDQWLRIVFKPPAHMTEEPCYDDFDQLTQALQLWALRHGFGSGVELTDAASAAYRREPIGDAVWRAQGFIDLMKNHSQMPTPTAAADGGQQPTGEPKLVDSSEAVEILGISERTLWARTKEGSIPCVRLGRSVRYNVDDLRRYIEANTKRGG